MKPPKPNSWQFVLEVATNSQLCELKPSLLAVVVRAAMLVQKVSNRIVRVYMYATYVSIDICTYKDTSHTTISPQDHRAFASPGVTAHRRLYRDFGLNAMAPRLGQDGVLKDRLFGVYYIVYVIWYTLYLVV